MALLKSVRQKEETREERAAGSPAKASAPSSLPKKPETPILSRYGGGSGTRRSYSGAGPQPPWRQQEEPQESGNLAEETRRSAIRRMEEGAQPETQAAETPAMDAPKERTSKTAYGTRSSALEANGIVFSGDITDRSRAETDEELRRREERDLQMGRTNGEYDARLDFSAFPDTDEGRTRARLAAEDMTPESREAFDRCIGIYWTTGLAPEDLYDEQGGYRYGNIDTLDKYDAILARLPSDEQKDFAEQWKLAHYLEGTGVTPEEYNAVSSKRKKRSTDTAWLKEVNAYVSDRYSADVNTRTLEGLALYAPDGSKMDVANASYPEIVAAVRRMPDNNQRSYATKLLKALSKNPYGGKYAGMVADDQEFDFAPPAEMASLAGGEWNKIAKGWSAQFFAGSGHEEDNALAYADIWNEINGEDSEYTPLERAVLNDELNRQFAEQAGLAGTPNTEAMLQYGKLLREAEAAEAAQRAAQGEADEAEDAPVETGKKGLWDSIKGFGDGAARFLFGDSLSKAEKEEQAEILAGEAPTDEPEDETQDAPESAGGGSAAGSGSGASGGEAATEDEPLETQAAPGGSAVTGRRAGTLVASAGAVPAGAWGAPLSEEELTAMREAHNAKKSRREALEATQAPMSEEELFNYWRAGGDLDELSTTNYNAFNKFFGRDALDFMAPTAARRNAQRDIDSYNLIDDWIKQQNEYADAVGIARPDEAFPESGEPTSVSVIAGTNAYVAKYGRQLGMAGMTILSGEYKPIEGPGMLALNGIRREIDRRVMDGEITIPAGENRYDYAIAQDPALAAQLSGILGSLETMKREYYEGAAKANEDYLAEVEAAQERRIHGEQTAQDDALLEYYAEQKGVDNEKSELQTGMLGLLNGSTQSGLPTYFDVWNESYVGQFYAFMKEGAYGGEEMSEAQKDDLTERSWGMYSLFQNYVNTTISGIGYEAASIGMSTEEYLTKCGVIPASGSKEERLQAAFDYAMETGYNRFIQEGAEAMEDKEAQEALDAIARVGVLPAIGVGAAAGVVGAAYRFTDAAYLKIDAAEYDQRRYEVAEKYMSAYGVNAPAMYLADILAYADSGALGEESRQALLSNVAYAQAGGNLFDLAYDPDPEGFSAALRAPSAYFEKQLDDLNAFVQDAPEYERQIFSFASSATNSLVGMLARAGIMSLEGAAGFTGVGANFAATWTTFGAQTYSEKTKQGMIQGMGPQAASTYATWQQLGTTLVNMGTTENEMELFRDSARDSFIAACQTGSWKGAAKAAWIFAKGPLGEAVEEMEEFTVDTFIDFFKPVIQKAVEKIEVTASDYLDALVSGIGNTDAGEFVSGLIESGVGGALQSVLFTLGGTAKSFLSAKRELKIEKKYASAAIAGGIVRGELPATHENVGKMLEAIKSDITDAGYRKWINKKTEEAQVAGCIAASARRDIGIESRMKAALEGRAYQEWEAKQKDAKAAMENSKSALQKAREAAIAGDSDAANRLMGLVNDYTKDATAWREAVSAMEKHKQAGQEAFSAWMGEVKEAGLNLYREIKQLRQEGLAQRMAENGEYSDSSMLDTTDFWDIEFDEESETQYERMSDEEIDAAIAEIEQEEGNSAQSEQEIREIAKEIYGEDAAPEDVEEFVRMQSDSADVAEKKGKLADALKDRYARMIDAIGTMKELGLEEGEAFAQIGDAMKQAQERLSKLGITPDKLKEEIKKARDSKRKQETERISQEYADRKQEQYAERERKRQEVAEGEQLTEAEMTAEVDAFIEETRPNASEEEKARMREHHMERMLEKWVEDVEKSKAIASAKINQDYIDQVSAKYGVKIETQENVPFRGRYDRETGTITLNANITRREAMIQVLLHELTHRIEGTSEYVEISRALMDMKYKGKTAKTDRRLAVQEKVKNYKKQGVKINYTEARAEVVADLTREMLYSSEASIRNFAKKSPGVVRRVLDTIRDFIAKITGNQDPVEAELKALRRKFERALGEAKERGAEKGGAKYALDNAKSGAYDYSKPFAEQVDDWMAGKFNQSDTLVIGPTPDVFQKIGLPNLPVVIDQKHTDYAINGTKNEDHHMGADMFKKLPELLKDPIAIIESATRADDSLVAIVEGEVNGKQMMAAVGINGIGKTNGEPIDATILSSTQGRKNAVTKLLQDAIQKENADQVGVYYWKKSEARSLYARTGVQFPGTSIQDGLIHSIFDAGSPVNREFVEQTETQQFKRWFNGSKAVDEDGKPLVLYHGTDETFEAFDMSKGRANMDIQGAFFSPWEDDARGYGSNVGAYYLSIRNPAPESVAYRALNRFKGQNGAGIKAREYLESLGYDGVNNGGEEWIAFRPEQIKSATDNRGDFDKTNPKFRYSLPESSDEAFTAFLERRGITADGVRKAIRQPGQKESQYAAQTAQKTAALTETTKQMLRDEPYYQTTSQKKNLETAMRKIEERGYEDRRNHLFADDKFITTPEGQAEAYVLAKMARDSGRAEDEAGIAFLVKESGTQLAQAMAMRNLWSETTPEGKVAYVQKVVDQINDRYEKKEKETRVTLPEGLRERIAAAMGDEEAMDDVLMGAWKDIADQMPPDWETRINGWRYMSMLLNPRTHIRNVMGNAVFMPAVAIKNKVGAALEIASGAEERTKTLGVIRREYRDFAKSQLNSVHDTLTGGGKMSPMNAISQSRRSFNSGILEWLSNKNGEYLEREDALFLNRHFENAMAGYLQANKVDLSAIDDATLHKALDYAISEAQKATYRDASKLADTLNKLAQRGDAFGLIVESTVPFKKTPINVAKRGIEYSPVGLLRTLTLGMRDLTRGKITANQFIDSLAAGLTGTGLAAFGVLGYSMGFARGKDKDKRDDIEALTGEQEYAITIGGLSFTVDWMAPSAIPFFVGVEFSRLLADEGKFSFSNVCNPCRYKKPRSLCSRSCRSSCLPASRPS